MEHRYLDHIILVTAAGPSINFRWKPNCAILAEGSRKLIKLLEWDLDYDSPEEAERIGLIMAKKWIGT